MKVLRSLSVAVAVAGMLWLWIRLLDADGSRQFEARSEYESRNR